MAVFLDLSLAYSYSTNEEENEEVRFFVVGVFWRGRWRRKTLQLLFRNFQKRTIDLKEIHVEYPDEDGEERSDFCFCLLFKALELSFELFYVLDGFELRAVGEHLGGFGFVQSLARRRRE